MTRSSRADRPALTLAQLFVWTTLATGAVAGLTFWLVLRASQGSILASSDRLRGAEAQRIGRSLSAEIGVAATALDEVATALRYGAVAIDDAGSLEGRLFTELLDHPSLSDVTITHAVLLGHEDDGRARLATEGRWQLSVFRESADPASAILTRRIASRGGHFVGELRRRAPAAGLLGAPFEPEDAASDPTAHPTFATAVSRDFLGNAIWSDLSVSDLDSARPERDRRVVVTVQRAVEDAPEHFAAVVRVGLLTQRIDELPRAATGSSQRVFLCDAEGRLVARLSPRDRLEVMGDDLRVVSEHVPPEVGAALSSPALRRISVRDPEASTRLVVAGAAYLATFRAIENSQDWRVGVVVPEDYYTRDLRVLEARFLVALGVLTILVLAAGGALLASVRAGLRRVVVATTRMRSFDFAPSAPRATLRELAAVMEGLERAKTSLRALSKYVPVDLVRELYTSNREPELGGELVELTLLFSDIEGFTGLGERLPPDELARALGRYLAAMTGAVQSTGGTVDKFIGDSVMAFWNAPSRCEDHALRACRAVLECQRAAAALFASPAWAPLPPLVTRFGLNSATVMVGHFGAPDRLGYTALGDGVNLASRLEGLCKGYGVTTLASEAVVARARGEVAFRMVDRVAVKGKRAATVVYELLGARGDVGGALLSRAAAYEEALAAYFSRDFSGALARFEALAPDDPPSAVLAARCAAMVAHPPPDDWGGVHVALTK